MPKIEMGKTYETREGCPVRIYSLNAGGPCPVHGAVLDEERNFWIPQMWSADGTAISVLSPRCDLIEVRPERTGWINIYPHRPDAAEITGIYPDRETAGMNAASSRIACIQVTFREGDGLES